MYDSLSPLAGIVLIHIHFANETAQGWPVHLAGVALIHYSAINAEIHRVLMTEAFTLNINRQIAIQSTADCSNAANCEMTL